MEEQNTNTSYFTLEVQPTCNFDCPDCVVANRLDIPKKDVRNHPNLDDLVCEYVPRDTHLFCIGLGETLLPKGQERIENILKNREDITAFALTNGSRPLSENLRSYVDGERLEIGVSLDTHHFVGNKGREEDYLRIQKDLISAVSVAVNEKDSEETINSIQRRLQDFKNLDRVLYDPFLSSARTHNPRIVTSWDRVRAACESHLKTFDDSVQPYTQIGVPSFDKMGSEYVDDCLKDLELSKTYAYGNKDWYEHPSGFYVGIGDNTNEKIIMTDGSVLTDSTINNRGWEELDRLRGKKVFPIEQMKW